MASKRMNGQFSICFDDSKRLVEWTASLNDLQLETARMSRQTERYRSITKLWWIKWETWQFCRGKRSQAEPFIFPSQCAIQHQIDPNEWDNRIGWWQKKLLLFQKVKCTFANRMLNNYRLDVVALKEENTYTTDEMAVKWWQTSTGT